MHHVLITECKVWVIFKYQYNSLNYNGPSDVSQRNYYLEYTTEPGFELHHWNESINQKSNSHYYQNKIGDQCDLLNRCFKNIWQNLKFIHDKWTFLICYLMYLSSLEQMSYLVVKDELILAMTGTRQRFLFLSLQFNIVQKEVLASAARLKKIKTNK